MLTIVSFDIPFLRQQYIMVFFSMMMKPYLPGFNVIK